jgi:uncharacterized protein (TIGR03792 family)
MVIEWLEFQVKPEAREKFIQKDQEIWTKFLAKQPGFLGKELWINPTIEEQLIIVVHWQTKEQWKAVPQNLLDDTEAKFSLAMGTDNYQLTKVKEFQVRKFRENCQNNLESMQPG